MADKDSIADAWHTAVADLQLEVIAPYVAQTDKGEYEFIALIKNFGSEQGTLLCLPEQWDDEGFAGVAEQLGFYCSGIYPESYCRYDRQHFIDTLNDWGWFGDQSKTPKWYTRKA
jgi:hypothetical protein